jgi:hypothetical protein
MAATEERKSESVREREGSHSGNESLQDDRNDRAKKEKAID